MNVIYSEIVHWSYYGKWVGNDFVSWYLDKTAYPIQFEEGAEIIKCGILLKKASKNPFKRWKQKFVVVTVGHLYWFPIDSSAAANGVVAITEKMRKNRHEMSISILFSSSF